MNISNIILLLFILIITYSCGLNLTEKIKPDSKINDDFLNGSQLIASKGFPVETHSVQTSDGYILTMVRIPCGGPPVFLMHGIIMSSDDYIIAGPDSAIAYQLAEEGYDVWMGNARGSHYSRSHVTLSPDKDTKFWDFSWNEIGMIDVPAMIDFVLNITKQSKLSYVGHSQGATSFFVMCSERPEYNNKITVMIALAPAVYFTNVKSPLFTGLAIFEPELYAFIQGFNYPNELFPNNKRARALRKELCGTAFDAALLCLFPMFPLIGFDFLGQNYTNLPDIFQHAPGGSSAKQVLHYFQLFNSKRFCKFDYRSKKNLEVYGTAIPPSYPLQKVTAPVSVFYSDGDWIISTTDSNLLRNSLPNVIGFYRVPFRKFNHLDYVWGKNIKTLVYYKLSQTLKKYVSMPSNNTKCS